LQRKEALVSRYLVAKGSFHELIVSYLLSESIVSTGI
jgi:hypothetical protein